MTLHFLFALIILQFSHPLARASEICSTRYAELINSFTRLNPETLRLRAGIEIEGWIPKQIGYQGVAEAIHSELLHHDPNAQVKKLSETHFEVSFNEPHGETKTWTVIRDKSIRTDETTLEITSPILESRADFRKFSKMLKVIEKLGAKSEPKGGGVHIHIDFNQARAGEMALLAGVFSEVETELKELFSMTRSRGPFAENTSPFLSYIIKRIPMNDTPLQRLSQLIIAQDRHHALNLRSYVKYKTVELRLFNSTFDIEALQLMLDFSIKLVHAIRTQDRQLMKYLLRDHSKIQLQDLARILNMKISKPKAKIILDRILQEAEQSMKDPSDSDYHGSSSSRTLSVLLGSTAAIQLLAENADTLISPSFIVDSND